MPRSCTISRKIISANLAFHLVHGAEAALCVLACLCPPGLWRNRGIAETSEFKQYSFCCGSDVHLTRFGGIRAYRKPHSWTKQIFRKMYQKSFAMGFSDLVISIGFWPIPAAALIGFSFGYVLRRSIWVLYVWPWDDTVTASWIGASAGFVFGIISVQIRPIIFELSFVELIGFILILAFVSLLAAAIGSLIARKIQQRKLDRLNKATVERRAQGWDYNSSLVNVKEMFVLGHSFRRMTAEERKELNRTMGDPDIFIYWTPRGDGYIVYEPTQGIITDNSRGNASPQVRYWLASK